MSKAIHPNPDGPHSPSRAQYQRLLSFVRARVRHSEDAEEILQDLFLRVLQAGPQQRIERLDAWLMAAARNAVIDHHRRKRPEITELPDALSEPTRHENPREAVARCMRPLLETLPAADRDILTAVDLQGTSQKDYAERTGLPYSTAKSRLQRARRRLHAAFTDCCEVWSDRRGTPSGCRPRNKDESNQ